MIVQEELLRKHGPADSRMLRPRLGGLSSLALLAVMIFQLAAIPRADPGLEQLSSQLWLAAIWAGWSAWVWILIQPPLSLARLAAAALLLAWHCVIMEVAREQRLERYVIMFAGFAVWQSTAAILLRIPRWRLPRFRGPLPRAEAPAETAAPPPEPRPGQFGILSILVLMTVSAGVLLAVRRYGQTAGEGFLWGAALTLLLLAVVAASAMVAATASRWAVALLMLMLLIAGAASAATAWQEVAVAGVADLGRYWRIYVTVEASFGLLLWAIGICGRLDAADPRR